MQTEQLLRFGPYRLNPHTGQLWQDKQEVRLAGKASALLCYLVEHAEQIVTKNDLAEEWHKVRIFLNPGPLPFIRLPYRKPLNFAGCCFR